VVLNADDAHLYVEFFFTWPTLRLENVRYLVFKNLRKTPNIIRHFWHTVSWNWASTLLL